MDSKIAKELRLKNSPVAVILTNDKPSKSIQFKEGAFNGCAASMMLAASKGKQLSLTGIPLVVRVEARENGRNCGKTKLTICR